MLLTNHFGSLGGGGCAGFRGGYFPWTKGSRVSSTWKKLPGKFMANLDWVFSRLGLKSKLLLGYRLKAGCKVKFYSATGTSLRPEPL